MSPIFKGRHALTFRGLHVLAIIGLHSLAFKRRHVLNFRWLHILAFRGPHCKSYWFFLLFPLVGKPSCDIHVRAYYRLACSLMMMLANQSSRKESLRKSNGFPSKPTELIKVSCPNMI
ncbi:hypothetical protein JHK85_006815 [Glycine max]|nr:hypothetical protein JHK85_006815 [Glycine max]